jgi:hypothetical protein
MREEVGTMQFRVQGEKIKEERRKKSEYKEKNEKRKKYEYA